MNRTTSSGEPLHEFFGACVDSYNINLDDDTDDDGSGRPGIMLAANAISFWLGMRGRDDPPSTVGLVAQVFNMPEEAVAQAVDEHPWMFLGGPMTGPVGDRVIEADGE